MQCFRQILDICNIMTLDDLEKSFREFEYLLTIVLGTLSVINVDTFMRIFSADT